jgi:HEAT repeat protein
LIQVLTVCQHLGTSITTEDLSWLTAILEHEEETIRAATVRALGAFGWRKDIRDDRFLFRLTRDPSPQVRGAVYETLSQWGDKPALDTLIATLKTEENKRACLTGTNALVEHRDQLDEEALEELGEMWDWSQTHAEYDTAARQRVDRVGK